MHTKSRPWLYTPYDAASRAYFAAMTVRPQPRLKHAIDIFIRALKSSGAWTAIDAGYLFWLHDEQAARVNFKAPGSYTIAYAGGMSASDFTAYRGFTGDGLGKYLDTGIAPSTVGQWAQDSGHVGVWVQAANASVNNVVGSVPSIDAATRVLITPKTSGTRTNGRSGNATNAQSQSYASPPREGHTLISRTDAPGLAIYRDGAALTVTTNQASDGGQSDPVLLFRNGAAYAADTLAGFEIGRGLTAAETFAIYSARLNFGRAVGALA